MPPKIYKYPITAARETVIDMPKDRNYLHVEYDPQGTLCVWALVDPTGPVEKVRFRVFDTGDEVPDQWGYLSTFQRDWYVGHVFVWIGGEDETRQAG